MTDTTDKLVEQIKADRENGTQGPFQKTSDHEWYLDTGGENAYFVISGRHGPFAVVAVEEAWGMDEHNEADMRRVCAIPDMEARILSDAETIKAAKEMAAAAEVVCVKCESTTEAVTILDQTALREALAAFNEALEARK
jgi:hypothetical protein